VNKKNYRTGLGIHSEASLSLDSQISFVGCQNVTQPPLSGEGGGRGANPPLTSKNTKAM